MLLETDHKPLIPFLGQQLLDQLPLRVQRFRLRLMHYSYNISYVLGKNLHTADALSRAPVKNDRRDEDFGGRSRDVRGISDVRATVQCGIHCHDNTYQTSVQRRSRVRTGDGILRTWLAANHDRESRDARIIPRTR